MVGMLRWVFLGITIACSLWLWPNYIVSALWPRKPFVYHYQWPVQFGDQQMTICTRVENEDEHECPRDYISSEL